MIPTEDHISALREIIAASNVISGGGVSSDADADAALRRLSTAIYNAELLLDGGQRDEGERTPSAMETGIGGDDIETAVGHTDDGFVVLRFNKLIQWMRLDPMTTIQIAEAMITAAQAGSKIWMPRTKKKLVLPGLPEGS